MHITSDSDMLLADQVERALLQKISKMNELEKLPNQDEMTRQYGVSIQTIRTVVARLKAKKLIRSIKGKGMFVTPCEKATGNVLVVAERFSGPYKSTVVSLACDMLLCQGLTPVMSEGRELERRSQGALGALVLESSPETEDFLESSGIHSCGINNVFDMELAQSRRFQTVRNNAWRRAYLAAAAALASGHERLILFSGRFEFAWSQDFLRGCRDALRSFKTNQDALLHFQVPLDSDPAAESFCAEARSAIGKSGQEGKTAIVDCSGAIFSKTSFFYHRIAKGLIPPESSFATEFVESTKICMADTVVFISLSPIVKRGIDLILGRAKPFALCETIDSFQIAIENDGKRTFFQPEDYFDGLKRGTLR